MLKVSTQSITMTAAVVWLSSVARWKLGLLPLGTQSTGKEEHDIVPEWLEPRCLHLLS
jgi:hypothetical protein